MNFFYIKHIFAVLTCRLPCFWFFLFVTFFFVLILVFHRFLCDLLLFSLLSCLFSFVLILSCRFITYIQVFAVLCSSFAFSFCHCVPVVFWCPLLILCCIYLILFFISYLVISVLFNYFGYYFNIIPYLYLYIFGAPCVVWLLFYVWCVFCGLNQ